MDKLPEDNVSGKYADARLFPNRPLKYLSANTIIGDKVHDNKDEPMGKIDDIMIDINTGQVDYVVIEYGGFLTIGAKYFAIPLNMLQVDENKKLFMFKGDKERLINAPGFDISHWPDTNLHKEAEYWHFID